MNNEYIQVDNSTEYNKNNSVKAYQSLIYHTKLKKTVKVRHKEYTIYEQKFNEAVGQLRKEWYVTKTNIDINVFINKAVKLHIFAFEKKPFNYKQCVMKIVRETIGKSPSKPNYEKLVELSSKPNKKDSKYVFDAKWFHKIFGIDKKRQEHLNMVFETDSFNYNAILEEYNEIKKRNIDMKNLYNKDMRKYSIEEKMLNQKYDLILGKYKIKESDIDIAEYFKTSLRGSMEYNNLFDSIDFEIDFDLDDNVIIVDFQFPDSDAFPKAKEYKYVKTRNEIKETHFKNKEVNELIKDTYYSLYMAIAYEIFRSDIENVIDNLVLNGYFKGIDKRKGTSFEACIMTSKISSSEFKEIEFSNINPRDTFKYLSGKGIPDISNICKVEPIRFVDNSRFKLIDSDSVLQSLSADTNLAAMDWKDFETLIRDVFELEFQEQNIEVRNTQYSNDGGIDVVAFNNNPYTGGIILLQAKRYTNIVTPEPVRALKGSMEDHKAIRGILVTTSDFGGSSREFAMQHNITLINGYQLVDLMKKHNYDVHIDLEQAKIVNAQV